MTVQSLDTFLSIEATAGGLDLYSGYIEPNLHIPRISGYDENIQLMVIPNSTNGDRVSIKVGMGVTGEVINVMTPEEVQKANEAWRIMANKA